MTQDEFLLTGIVMTYTLLQMHSWLLRVERIPVYMPLVNDLDPELLSDHIQPLASNNQSREEVIGSFQVNM